SKAVGIDQRRDLRHEIANEDDKRENEERGDPKGNDRTLEIPQQEETDEDQRKIAHRIAEQDDAEEAARVFQEFGEVRGEIGAALFEAFDVERLERKKRGLDRRKHRRSGDEDAQNNGNGDKGAGSHHGASE